MNEEKQDSLQVLSDIRNMMDRSSRVLSLSGWSGIWAGLVALAATAVAYLKLEKITDFFKPEMMGFVDFFLLLALTTLFVAVVGAFYFSYRKNKKQGHTTFNKAAKNMVISMCIPMFAGGWMCIIFLAGNDWIYIIPTMLIFYGLTLINSSKYTVSDIRWLGLLEVITGCFATLSPELGLYFWAFGFGILHIVYGIIMWSKYDRKQA